MKTPRTLRLFALGAIIAALLASFAFAQALALPPRLYVYYKLPADTLWSWLSVAIDAPLTLTRDAAGQVHLAVIAPVFVDAETPGGTLDGVNNTFTLVFTPSAGSLHLFCNGVLMAAGSDYTLNASAAVFAPDAIPKPGATLIAAYRH